MKIHFFILDWMQVGDNGDYSISFTESDVDYTNPENLSGTNWKCTDAEPLYGAGTEYIYMKFLSTLDIEGGSKETNEDEVKEFTGTYTVDGSTIYIDNGYETNTGTIDGTNISMEIEGNTYVFAKQ